MSENKRPLNRAVIVYTLFPDAMSDAQQDVIEYADVIAVPLTEMGYDPVQIGVSLDLNHLVQRLIELKPAFVFNLVDELSTHDQLLYVVPSVMEAFDYAFTGVGAQGNFLTTDKVLAKEMMHLRGIPTPPWQRCDEAIATGIKVPLPCIVKPVATDSSHGIGEGSLCRTPVELTQKIASIEPKDRHTFFAEHYIDGREFNLSMIATADGIQVLPPAEMTFIDYPPGKPTIVDFKAKWVPDSFEFNHTVRRFDFPETDTPLLEELKNQAMMAWPLFGLCGYARVDFRIDKAGKAWVLEVNANPCIAPDAGFIAAAEKAGMNFSQIIKLIVEDALRRKALRLGNEESKSRRRARRRVLDKKR